MVDAVSKNMDKIVALCKQMGVESLYLFGSGARGKDYHSNSDLDILFRFKKDNQGLPIFEYDYFDLLFKLQEITNMKVDLVAEERIENKYFLERVLKEKVKLYESGNS